MSTAIIEINDAGLRAGLNGEISIVSPGFAVMDGNRLLVGEEGMRNARLLPRWTNNRFWNQLGTEPVPNGTEMVRHHADIAFVHLEEVWRQVGSASTVIMAVPGFYSREQLGLLLGMARECNIPVSGLVDSSLVSVSGLPAHETILHLEIFLHRITLTVLRSDSLLRRAECVTISETGLFTLWDRWANVVASQFIRTSRYDPMHQAVSEQQLYDKLPGWITSLGSERSAAFELNVGTTRHQVTVSREQLLGACAAIYPQIVQLIRDHTPAGEVASLFVSHRFQGFPGLDDSLGLIDNVDLVRLEAQSVFNGIVKFEDKIVSDGAVSHVTSLPGSAQRPAHTPARRARRATHLLIEHHAVAIGNALRLGLGEDGAITTGAESPRCTVYLRGRQTLMDNHSGDAVRLNGRAAPPQAELQPGDVLGIGDHDLTLISVG